MLARNLMVTVAFAFGLTALAGEARSWGHEGHRIVAAIAMKLLPPAKGIALDKLLKESELNRGFIEAAGYADDVLRGETHEFDSWHYVDWPDDSMDSADQSCTPTCILKALTQQIKIAKTSSDPEDKALALSWIIHLTGDLHQPLHVADRDGDKGGNSFAVTYKGEDTCGPPSWPRAIKRVQLHKVWDDCLVLTLESGKGIQEVADQIRGGIITYEGHPFAEGTQRDWAKESHQIAHTHAYANLEQNDDLGDEYINRALPVVRDQLLRAGVRLAKTIDRNM